MVVNVVTCMKTCDSICLAVEQIGCRAKAAWTVSRGRTGLTGVSHVYCFIICFCCLTFWSTAVVHIRMWWEVAGEGCLTCSVWVTAPSFYPVGASLCWIDASHAVYWNRVDGCVSLCQVPDRSGFAPSILPLCVCVCVHASVFTYIYIYVYI